jgi:hypothetical protein
MLHIGTQRWVVLAALVSAGLGASVVLAVQAGASGGGGGGSASPSAPRPGSIVRPAMVRPAVLATDAQCGETVTASLTLNGDLVCTGDGLIVTGNSVILNLNGHAIEEQVANGTGVWVRGASDTVENGAVTGFIYGVLVDGAKATVSSVRVFYSSLNGIVGGAKLTNDVAAFNAGDGIVAFGAAGETLSGDHESSNGFYGLALFGSTTTVTGNIAEANKYIGIYDNGIASKLTNNIANFNGNDGIYTQDATVIDGGGNSAKGNDWSTGVPQTQCEGVICN